MAKRSSTTQKTQHRAGKAIPPAGRARAKKSKENAILHGPETTAVLGDLTVSQRAFVAAYDKHLGNGARAYEELHPTSTYETCCVNASRLLRIAKVRAAVDAVREARWKRMHMDGDEALALIAADARADVRLLFNAKGELLNPHEWPDDIAASIEAVDIVNGKIKLASKSSARRLILEQTGKIKGLGAGLSSLAQLLAGDYDGAKA